MTTEVTPAAQTSTANVTSPIVTDGQQPVVSSPVVEPNQPDAEPSTTAEPVPSATEPSTDTSKSTPEWAQKRINELTAKRYEAERNAQAEQERRIAAEKANAELLSRLSGAQPTTPDPTQPAKPPMSEDEIERRALEKATEMARINEFNKSCNIVATNGEREFRDWDEAMKNLGLVGAIGKGAPIDFLETAIELKDPHKVLHHLGKNIDEAEKIAKMPPKKMALEMARLEAQLNAPAPAPVTPPVSNAPAPVIPVGGAAKPGALDIGDPNLGSADWFELRAKQIEERKSRYRKS